MKPQGRRRLTIHHIEEILSSGDNRRARDAFDRLVHFGGPLELLRDCLAEIVNLPEQVGEGWPKNPYMRPEGLRKIRALPEKLLALADQLEFAVDHEWVKSESRLNAVPGEFRFSHVVWKPVPPRLRLLRGLKQTKRPCSLVYDLAAIGRLG